MEISHSTTGRLTRDTQALFPLPELPRLKILRDAILNTNYHVCTQKTSLLTRYFKKNVRGGWLEKILAPVHYQMYKRSLFRSAQGRQQQSWQVAFNNRLNSLYKGGRRLTASDYLRHYALAFRYIIEHMELKVYDHELIVGNPSAPRVGAPIHPDYGGLLMLPEIRVINSRQNNPMELEAGQLEELAETIFPYWFNKSVLALTPLYSEDPSLFNTMLEGRYFVLTQFSGISHVTPDYPAVLRLGFNGIADGIRAKLEEARTEYESCIAGGPAGLSPRLKDRMIFYESALICAEAAAAFGKRWSRHLEHQASREADEKRKKELLFLSDIFNRVPAEPAESFYEALQSVFTAHVMLHYESFQHGISFGRMDQYLFPYYKRDLESGRLTRERAAELLGCFIAKAGELVPLFFERATEYFSGLSSASGITLGGRKDDGTDGINDLSCLFLQAYDQVRLRQPNFHVRINKDTPSGFIDLCCEILKKGGGLPAFFNDDEIAAALERSGIERKDAEDYSVVGCVEWGIPGRSFPAAGAIFLNIPMALYLALHNGKYADVQFGPQTGEVNSLTSMDAIVEALRIQLENIVRRAVDGNNAIEHAHAQHRPTPMLSILVDGCVDKGQEVSAGGAKYNSTGCQGVGLADAADSLTAIEQLVFNEKKLTLEELTEIVDGNFGGQPELLSYILNRVPKYGENEERPNYYAGLVSGMFTRLVALFQNPRGGRYFPGFWSMTTHQGFGARTGALPNGRLAGQPLANGVSPANGRDRSGLTASLSSAAGLDKDLVANGYALNEKLDLALIKDPSRNRLIEGLIQGFFASGGMQVQFNIIDPAILIDAKEHPEQHRGLVVRVSGYSAYFNDLTAGMKDELIARISHDCGC